MAALCWRLASECEAPSIGRRAGGPTNSGLDQGLGLQGPQNRWRGWADPWPRLIRRIDVLRREDEGNNRSPLPRRGQHVLDDDYDLSIAVKGGGIAVFVIRRAFLGAG